ncbi:heparan sulfate glucosamine 3-O-sulfotransferase 6-like [Styela clava]
MARIRRFLSLLLAVSISATTYISILKWQPNKKNVWNEKLQSLYQDFPFFEPRPTTFESRKREWEHYSDMSKNKTKARRLPDVVGIGVKKCGTDAVISFLRHHPFMKVPDDVETFFFNHKYNKGLNYYRSLMPEVAEHELIMEKTPAYFDCPPVTLPNRLYRDIPHAKLILVVCDPVKRSFSDYAHERARYEISSKNRDVAEFETFDSYLDFYLDRVNRSTSLNTSTTLYNHMSNYYKDHAATLLTTGFYSVFLPRWTELFNSSRLMVISGEDILNNPGVQMERIQDFLGIPKLLREGDFVKNPSNGFFCVRPWWKNYNFTAETNSVAGWEENLSCLSKTKGRTRHKDGGMDANIKHVARLKALFEPFNEELYQMTGIDYNMM